MLDWRRSTGIRTARGGRDPAVARASCHAAWLLLAGLLVLIASGRFAPLLAYGLILIACALIGHGGNIFIRALLAEGLRIRGHSRRSRPMN